MPVITILILGAILKEIKILGFGGPGLKIQVLKENNCPAPVLEGEGRIYSIFGVRAFEILGGMPEKDPKQRIFGCAFNCARP